MAGRESQEEGTMISEVGVEIFLKNNFCSVNPIDMKKNIIIVLLLLFSAASVVYGLVQRAEAVKQREMAEQNARQAVEMQALAQAHMKMADEQRSIP